MRQHIGTRAICVALLMLAAMLFFMQMYSVPRGQSAVDAASAVVDNKNETVACKSCQFLVHMLSDYVQKNSTIAVIEEFAIKLCDFVADPFERKVCPEMIRQMAPIIIESLLQRENPLAICQMIRMCPKDALRAAELQLFPMINARRGKRINPQRAIEKN